MKNILTMVAMFTAMVVHGQQFKEKVDKELSFEKRSPDNTLMIANVNGGIKVMGYDGDKIIIEATKVIQAKTDSRLETAKNEVRIEVIDRADTLIVYTEDACSTFGKQTKQKRNGAYHRGWGYSWNNDRNCSVSYDYKIDFVVKVPANIHVVASTVNEGDVLVENVKGIVYAFNINGSIKLSNLVRESEASTINGDVDIDYTTNPVNDCRFYTLNGDINAFFSKGLAANFSFESFNGSFFTNMTSLKSLPVEVKKYEKADGIKYKVSGNRYQVGNGGVHLDFETFNGNVYLKEKE